MERMSVLLRPEPRVLMAALNILSKLLHLVGSPSKVGTSTITGAAFEAGVEVGRTGVADIAGVLAKIAAAIARSMAFRPSLSSLTWSTMAVMSCRGLLAWRRR